MKHEFYINNELLDVDDNMNFNIVFNSTIFGDLSKIKTHGTTALKFPLTANNRRIIKNINMHDISTKFPYQTHTMDYYRNGVNIVLDGTCYVIGIDEKYVELQLIFGVKNLLTALSQQKLKDLDPMSVRWTNDNPTIISPYLRDYGFPLMNFGAGAFAFVKYSLPAISIRYVLEQIQYFSGITFEGLLDKEEIADEIKRLYLTCIDRSIEGMYWEDYMVGFNLEFNQNNLLQIKENNYIYNDLWGIIDVSNNRINIIEDCNKVRISFSYEVYVRENWEEWENPAFKGMMYIRKNGSDVFSVAGQKKVENKYGTIQRFFDFSVSFEDEAVKSDKYSLYFHVAGYNFLYWHDPISFPQSKFNYVYFEYNKLVFPSTGFPINSNLPDLTFTNVLQIIIYMFGLFPYYDYNKPNTLSFFSVDDVLKNMENGNYYDWTGKRRVIKMKHDYTYGDYAQQNKLDYKKDDTVITNASGFIEVENENLDSEKNLLELNVSAADRDGDRALIRAFTIEELDKPWYQWTEDSVSFKKTQPHIIKIKGTEGVTTLRGTFDDDMYFGGANGIIANKYKGYQNIVRTPVVVEAEYLLNEVDLIDFDIRKPVWDSTLGRSYAVIDLTMQRNNVAKVKMIDISQIQMTD